jgi:Amt family ammonium transporter
LIVTEDKNMSTEMKNYTEKGGTMKKNILPCLLMVMMLSWGCSAAMAADPVADPSGTHTGVAADVVNATLGAPTADELTNLGKTEPLAAKLADVIGHNRIAINTVWTLICGFLVMFMQAGFALAEGGFTRAKNAGHTMAMNFMIYGIGILGYWLCGFAIQMGGVGGVPLLAAVGF